MATNCRLVLRGEAQQLNTLLSTLARGLAVVNAFQERKRQLTIAQISHRTEIPRAAVRCCLYTLMKRGNVSTHAGRVPARELKQHFLPLMLSASRELSRQLFKPL